MTQRTRTERQQAPLRHRRGRALRTAAATAAVAAVLAACGAADDDRDGAADSSEVGDDGAATGGVGADETPEDPAADGDDPGADDSGSGGGLQACDADQLEPAYSGPEVHDDGTAVHLIRLTSLAPEACELADFPTVTPLDADRQPLGEAAVPEAEPVGPLTVGDGDTVRYELRTVAESAATACLEPASYLEVEMPDGSGSFDLRTDVRDDVDPPVVCDDRLEIGLHGR